MTRFDVELSDEDYQRLLAEAKERHEDAAVYAGRVLTQGLHRARFLEGSALFIGTPGMREEFTRRFGGGSTDAATAA